MPQIPDNSRFQQKKQKRRKGILLNVCIGIVLLAAITVAYQLFLSPAQQAVSENKNAEQKKTETESPKKEETKEKSTPASKVVEDKKIILQDQQDPNVVEAYTNPAWMPIGTSQSEPHTTTFDSSSVDWKEMVQSISYALNIPADTLTILFIGNNGPNKAIGTVQAKDTKQTYKVYIEWVEAQGWQPTLVQQMK